MCLSSPVDTFYVLGTGEELFGLTHTSMVFAPAQKRWASIYVYLSINHFIYTFTLSAFPDVRWEVVFTDNDTLLAYTNTTQLPLGLHTWHFEEGADCGNREVLISLHQHCNIIVCVLCHETF